MCDPMHGNTETSTGGLKTRRFENILRELELAFQIHSQCGSHLGGVHIELTGDDVTECTGGARGLTDARSAARLSLARSIRASITSRRWSSRYLSRKPARTAERLRALIAPAGRSTDRPLLINFTGCKASVLTALTEVYIEYIDELAAQAALDRRAGPRRIPADPFPEALDFIAAINQKFGARVPALLKAREERQKRLDAGELPDFLPETKNDPRVGLDRRPDPEGPAGPPRRDHRPHRSQDDHQRAELRREGVHGRLRRLACRRHGRTSSAVRRTCVTPFAAPSSS